MQEARPTSKLAIWHRSPTQSIDGPLHPGNTLICTNQPSPCPSASCTHARLHFPQLSHATADTGVGGFPCPKNISSCTGRVLRHHVPHPLPLCPVSNHCHTSAQGAAITRFCKIDIATLSTGISPMLSIGQMERFQPVPSGWRCLQDAPNATKAFTSTPPSRISVLPKLRRPWPHLGSRVRKIRGDDSRRASPITMQMMDGKSPDTRPLQSV
jgi:hypothetical protein